MSETPPLRGAPIRVLRYLLTRGPQTAAAVADGLSLTSTAVRRHLDVLVRDGYVSASERAPYGPAARATRRGRGRPARVFTISAAGRDALDVLDSFEASRAESGYEALARDLVDFLARTGGSDAVAEFARERAQRARDRYGAALDGVDGVADRVTRLSHVLTDDGYTAQLTHVGAGGVQLCQHSCPVAHVAEEYPQFCQAEAQMFSDILGVNVTRLATIAGGAGVCTTHVPTIIPGAASASGVSSTAVHSPKEMA